MEHSWEIPLLPSFGADATFMRARPGERGHRIYTDILSFEPTYPVIACSAPNNWCVRGRGILPRIRGGCAMYARRKIELAHELRSSSLLRGECNLLLRRKIIISPSNIKKCVYIYAPSSNFSLPFEGRETLREVGFFSPLEKTSRGRTLVVDTISIHEENFNAVKGGYDEEIWLLFVPKRATLKLGISIENIVVRLLYINHELIPNFARIVSLS